MDNPERPTFSIGDIFVYHDHTGYAGIAKIVENPRSSSYKLALLPVGVDRIGGVELYIQPDQMPRLLASGLLRYPDLDHRIAYMEYEADQLDQLAAQTLAKRANLIMEINKYRAMSKINNLTSG